MSEQTALFYAEIFTTLQVAWHTNSRHDIWIAACTLEAGAVLITKDVHFRQIAGLLTNPL